MLKQLIDMGFENEEANLAALKFHYKYGEGLDAVIEDLLSQRESSMEEQKPMDASDEQPLEPKNDERKVEEKKKEEPTVEEKKEEKNPGAAGDTVMIDSFSDEDVEELMTHANISKAAAIKALKAQAW